MLVSIATTLYVLCLHRRAAAVFNNREGRTGVKSPRTRRRERVELLWDWPMGRSDESHQGVELSPRRAVVPRRVMSQGLGSRWRLSQREETIDVADGRGATHERRQQEGINNCLSVACTVLDRTVDGAGGPEGNATPSVGQSQGHSLSEIRVRSVFAHSRHCGTRVKYDALGCGAPRCVQRSEL